MPMAMKYLSIKKFRKTLSLRQEILFWMALVGIFPFLMVALPQFFFADKILLDLEKRSLELALSSRVYQIESWLKSVRRDIDLISKSNCANGLLCEFSPGSSPTECRVHASVLSSHPSFKSIRVYDHDWSLLTSSGQDDSCINNLSAANLRALFEGQKDYFVTDNYCPADNRTIITVGHRIKQTANGNTGYIVAFLDLKTAVDLFPAEPSLPTAKFYILTGQGHYIYPPGISPERHRTTEQQLPEFFNRPQELLNYTDPQQKQVLGMIRPVARTDWFLVKEIDKSIALESGRTLFLRTLIAGFVTVILILLTSFLVSRRLATPLEKMASAADAIIPSENRGWHKFPVFSHREIDRLGFAFNAMFDRLNNMEEQIARQTATTIRNAGMTAIGEFSAGIVHELRSPLSSINLAMLSIAKRTNNPEDQERIKIVLQQAQRLMKLVDQILDYGKPFDLAHEKITITALLQEVVDVLTESFHKKQLSCNCRYELLDNIVLWGDRNLLLQALINIVNNSIYWAPPSSSIDLEAFIAEPQNSLIIKVSDMGPGFSQEVQNRIFEPFFSTRKKGTGLGMAITSKIINLHHGRILITNRDGGGGSVSITIPLGEENDQGTDN